MVICQNVCDRFSPGGGNWVVVVVICQNVCDRFSPGGGFWMVAGFRGLGGRWVLGFRISLERKLTSILLKLYYTINFNPIHFLTTNSDIYIPLLRVRYFDGY